MRIKTTYLQCFGLMLVIERVLFLKANEVVLMLFSCLVQSGLGGDNMHIRIDKCEYSNVCYGNSEVCISAIGVLVL